MAVNAAIWGFLAGCVSGAAEAIFDTADQLNGLDAGDVCFDTSITVVKFIWKCYAER